VPSTHGTSIECTTRVVHGLRAVRELPLHHADPFDRLLLAQARCEDLRVVSADEAFGPYRDDVVDPAR
jgi:PIN domain nuclease of toxin-antitoxin system